MKNECEYIKAQGRLEQSNGHDVRSEDLYKLMCVQGVQRQDVIQCVQPGIIFKQSINHTELYMHSFLHLIPCSNLYN